MVATDKRYSATRAIALLARSDPILKIRSIASLVIKTPFDVVRVNFVKAFLRK